MIVDIPIMGGAMMAGGASLAPIAQIVQIAWWNTYSFYFEDPTLIVQP